MKKRGTLLVSTSTILLLHLFHLLYPTTLFGSEVVIVYSNNLNGILYAPGCPGTPCGGVARHIAVTQEVRRLAESTLVLTSGDLFSPTEAIENDTTLLKLLGLVGYDAVCIGDQEFSNGSQFLDLARDALPFISTNLTYRESGKPLTTPYMIKEVGGVRVLIASVVPKESFLFFPKEKIEGILIEDPILSLKRCLDSAQGKFDAVLVLSHGGVEFDKTLAKKVPDVDVVVGGHSQTLLHSPLKIGDTYILQAGGGGRRVGIFVLSIREGKIVSSRHKQVLLTEAIKIPDEVAKILKGAGVNFTKLPNNQMDEARLEYLRELRAFLLDARRLPKITLWSLSGRQVKISEHIGKEMVLVSFFATWCEPCIREIPALSEIQADHRQYLKTYLVNVEVEAEDVLASFRERHGIELPILVDSLGEAKDAFQVRRLPTTILIDRFGLIVKRIEGYHKDLRGILLDAIRKFRD
jgi:thiol-disulfide isomerase/thioredoxin